MAYKVSVLLPVFNAGKYLRSLIDSILVQTFDDFELLIVDDCSADESPSIISGYSDPRIRLIRNQSNCGIGPTMNKGIRAASGEYIARMDADDVSFPQRLERQVAFLDTNPGIGLCGGRVVIFHRDEEIDFSRGGNALPQEPDLIKMGLLFGPCVVHPTVMFRRDLFASHDLWYKPLRYAQDYELWSRAFFVLDPVNIPDTLLFYRVHSNSAASRVKNTQALVKEEIWKPLLQRLGLTVSDEELEAHSQLSDLRVHPDWALVQRVHAWSIKLLTAGSWHRPGEQELFRQLISRRFFAFLQYASKWGMKALILALRSKLRPFRAVSFHDRLKFAAKCLLRWERKSSRVEE